jgi:PAS domain S-box-containing protein
MPFDLISKLSIQTDQSYDSNMKKPLSSLNDNNSNVQPKPQVDSEGNFYGELRLFDDDVVSLLCMESGGTQMLNSDYSFSFEPDSQQELENVGPISGLEHNCNNLINECIDTNNLISDGQYPLDQGYIDPCTTVIYLQNKLQQLKERNQALKKELERQRQKTSTNELSSDDSWIINSQVGIVLAGSHNNLLTANDFFLNKLGYSREELSSLTYTDILHPLDRARAMSWCLKNMINRQNLCTIENIKLLKKKGDKKSPESYVTVKKVVMWYLYDKNSDQFDKLASEARFFFE